MRRLILALAGAALAAAAIGSACTDRTGPPQPAAGMLVVQPSFASAALAGIVPLARARMVLTRVPGGEVAKDTVVTLAAGQDSVDLRLSVSVLGSANTFLLRIALITPQGDTAFRAGPVAVQAGTGGTPPVVPVTFVYTGVGANAELVTITSPVLTLAIGQSLTLQADALDSAGGIIPGTPIGWRSLDPTVATVPAPEAGTVVGGAAGTARIVAELLTGPADTVSVRVAASAIVFAGDSAGGLSTGVFRVNRDGSGRARIYATSLGGYQWVNPRWAPDRSRVAFGLESAASGIIGLEVVSPDGLQTASVVSDVSVRYPRWSPDGVHLAFACGSTSASYSQWDVCVINDATGAISALAGRGNGTGRVVLTDISRQTRPYGMPAFGWDPTNPDRIAVVRDSVGALNSSRIFVTTFTGTGWTAPAPLSPAVMDAGTGPLTVAGDWLDWSPDGQHLVFAAYDPQYSWRIYRINRDGTGLVALTDGSGYDDAPLYSPDGSEILFWRDVSCSFDAWLMNADGSNPHQVTAEDVCDFQTSILGFDWSPDGQEIVITGFDAPYSNVLIYRLPRTTTAATYFTDRVLIGRGAAGPNLVQDIQPSWRP